MLQLDKDYDVSIESIQCNLDKIGAKVFKINGLRILAYTKEQAEQEERRRYIRPRVHNIGEIV